MAWGPCWYTPPHMNTKNTGFSSPPQFHHNAGWMHHATAVSLRHASTQTPVFPYLPCSLPTRNPRPEAHNVSASMRRGTAVGPSVHPYENPSPLAQEALSGCARPLRRRLCPAVPGPCIAAGQQTQAARFSELFSEWSLTTSCDSPQSLLTPTVQVKRRASDRVPTARQHSLG